ncbi:hypothetical protein LWI29_013911 [Acer saccharum]|uniref:Uncharacterized protein n=1 Tax=Acer saccharum TaxID=4024 RepID=A0AA39S323_ACESA|nr:hypothetical protein LWI29_013911 [Acer saccharum]
MTSPSKLPAFAQGVPPPSLPISSGSRSTSSYLPGSQKEDSIASSQSIKGKNRNQVMATTMDSFWQNSRPSYSPTCMANDEKLKLLQETIGITKSLESSNSSKEDMDKLRIEFEVERSKKMDETES